MLCQDSLADIQTNQQASQSCSEGSKMPKKTHEENLTTVCRQKGPSLEMFPKIWLRKLLSTISQATTVMVASTPLPSVIAVERPASRWRRSQILLY